MGNLRLSIQGYSGSFHHIAAEKLFSGYELLQRSGFTEVFEDVYNGRADAGLVAIENSIVGSLGYNYDRLAHYRIPIKGECYIRIAHHLMALPGVQMEDIKEIWSHPMALEQSRDYLDRYTARRIEFDDTAGAVRQIAKEQRRDVAAIAGKRAAELHSMRILGEHIETDPNNYTRFLVISEQPVVPAVETPELKTTVNFSMPNRPGSLVRILELFALEGIDMTRIESRPRIGSPWSYDFFIDLLLDANSQTGERVLRKADKQCDYLYVLGCYPRLYSDFPDH